MVAKVEDVGLGQMSMMSAQISRMGGMMLGRERGRRPAVLTIDLAMPYRHAPVLLPKLEAMADFDRDHAERGVRSACAAGGGREVEG